MTPDSDGVVYFDLPKREATLRSGRVVEIASVCDPDGDESDLDLLDGVPFIVLVCGPTPEGYWIELRVDRTTGTSYLH